MHTLNPTTTMLYIKTTEWSDKQLRKTHDDDAGYDIVAAESVSIKIGSGKTIKTGLFVAIPKGYVGIVKGRSGLAINNGIECCNAGVIDAGYRGEILVKLYNTSTSPDYVVQSGDRIAQLLILPIECPMIQSVDRLPNGDRGENGFGSTGR